MKKFVIALACILMILLLSLPLLATKETYLVRKSDDGATLILANGSVWEVSPVYTIDSALWLPTETIIIPDSEDCLINKDNGEKVGAQRIQ